MEQLRLVKQKDNFGISVYGTCMVVSHKGLVVTETTFDNGNSVYRFKVIGARKEIIDRAGNLKKQRQRLFCTVNKDSVDATVAKNLGYGDVLKIFGVVKTSEFLTDLGKKKRTSFCNLCDLTVKVKADGTQQNEVKTEEEFDEFEDFTD